MIRHYLIQTEFGYRCTTCHWKWRSIPTSSCPGVRRFARWSDLPTYLKTIQQLSKAGLKPRDKGDPAACLQPREGKPPHYWLYDQRQAIPLHRRVSAFGGESIQLQRAIAAQARQLWEKGEIYRELYRGVVVEAIPQILEKFIRFKARAKVSGIPGKFRTADVEANLGLPTHIEAVEQAKKFLDQILDFGIPNQIADRKNLHAYLEAWGGCFIRIDESAAGFYIRVTCEQEEQAPEEVLTPSVLPIEGEWWEILGVKPDATQTDVKKAYRRLAGMFHPDVNKSEEAHERTVALNRAYEQYRELLRTVANKK